MEQQIQEPRSGLNRLESIVLSGLGATVSVAVMIGGVYLFESIKDVPNAVPLVRDANWYLRYAGAVVGTVGGLTASTITSLMFLGYLKYQFAFVLLNKLLARVVINLNDGLILMLNQYG